MAASTEEAFEHIIQSYQNPATKRIMKLVPPAEVMNQAEYKELLLKFAEYCQESWKHRKDPDTLDPRLFRSWGEDKSDEES